MQEWLTRILFCLFADDTDIWERRLFEDFIEFRTQEDGSDLGQQIGYIFQLLNTPDELRSPNIAMYHDVAGFTYVGGDIFERRLTIPTCNEEARHALLKACRFNWAKVSPAIFGSLFQNVMAPAERRKLGAHYTTEENILRTIGPLFLDGLQDELARAMTRPALDRLHDKIANLKFLDPACGCGNFLIIAYRELRRLELEILRKQSEVGRAGQRRQTGQRAASLEFLCKVTVDQFYGIEIETFPALIARTALYMMDHLANLEISTEFGETYARFPIESSPHIHVGNALRIDWNDLLPVEEADYVLGNPPFSGHAMAGQNQRRKQDKEIAFAELRHSGSRIGRLDYVAAWYAKAIPYMLAGHSTTAFVSSNSLVQGEQARTMGPILRANGIGICFAHQTFKWTSDAKGSAAVHVVIIGLAPARQFSSRAALFVYDDVNGQPTKQRPKQISWYLADVPPVYPAKHSKPLLPGIPGPPRKGSQPTDNGNLIIDKLEYKAALNDPEAKKYLRRFRQARDFLHNEKRWCLWLENVEPRDVSNAINNSLFLRERFEAVKAFRDKSPTPSVRNAAASSHLFTQRRQPTKKYLAIPETSSEERQYVPMDYVPYSHIGGNALLMLPGAPKWLFGILQSSMWMAWIRTVGGRLESRIRIAPDIAYCAFPWPELTHSRRTRIEKAAAGVLSSRKRFATASLADLYEPLAMPPELSRAHQLLDRAVDAAYGRHKHTGDETRLPVLLRRYVELTGGDLTLFDDVPETTH